MPKFHWRNLRQLGATATLKIMSAQNRGLEDAWRLFSAGWADLLAIYGAESRWGIRRQQLARGTAYITVASAMCTLVTDLLRECRYMVPWKSWF
jgi:hypothetical protein